MTPNMPAVDRGAIDPGLDGTGQTGHRGGGPSPLDPPPAPDQHPIVAFAADVLGFPLLPRQADILSELYQDDIRYAVLRLGRRAGKGRMGAVVAVYEATVNAQAHLAQVPPGEQVAVVVVATSRAQARIVHRYIRSFLSVPVLASQVVRDSEDEIELANGMVLVTLPCSTRSTRGYGIAVLILDELAWFIDSDGSPLEAAGLWEALVPATATFPAGRILALSSPRWSTGFFADLCRRAESGEHPDMHQWHATTAEMRPDIDSVFLAAERAKDPAMFAREYEAQFVSGVGAVFDEAAVRAAVAPRGALDPQPGWQYTVAIDPAYAGDEWALVVAHPAGNGLVVDRVMGWRGRKGSPLIHAAVLDEVADVSRAYHHAPVLLDQYASEPIAQGLRERGVAALRKPWHNELKAAAVMALRGLLYGGRLELPDDVHLVAELLAYESRPLPSGRPAFAAPPGSTDDRVSALLALAEHLTGPRPTAHSFSYIPEAPRNRPVRRTGDLVLVGERYLDRAPSEVWKQWR